jgi:dienelactone hydrolase
MRWLRATTIGALLLAIGCAADRAREARTSWAGVALGSYAVGVSVRRLRAANDDEAAYVALVWRPVTRADGPGATLEALAGALCPDLDASGGARLGGCFPRLAGTIAGAAPAESDDALERLAGLRLAAALGGEPAAGDFPLAVVVGSLRGSAIEFASLGEALASRGWVVAAVAPSAPPAEAEFDAASVVRVRAAIRAAVDELSAAPGIDASRIAVVAWSFGGVPAALEAAADPRVDALVSLDSALRYAYGAELIRAAPDYRPSSFEGAFLSVEAGIDNEVAKDDALAAELAASPPRVVAVAGLDHGGFPDFAGALAAGVGSGAARAAFQRDRAAMIEMTAAFLAEIPAR